jgi:DNA-binding transcriptional LysR family regulator
MNANLSVRDFRFFQAVAEELHFGRAAEKLGVAQPHLSQHVKSIEDRLGVQLLERTTRSVTLTPAGEFFLERSKFMLNQIEDVVISTRKTSDKRRGHLNIGFTGTVQRDLLPSILETFRRSHPEIDISLSYGGTALQVEKLLDGRLEFGFLRLPIHTRRLNTLTIAKEGVVVALPKRHRLASYPNVYLEDLAGEEFIGFAPVLGVDYQEQVMGICQRAGFTPNIIIEATDTPSITTMVAAGFGIAILPAYVAHRLHPRVVHKQLSEIPPLVDIAMAWQAKGTSAVQRNFQKFVVDYLSGSNAASINNDYS